MLVVNTKKIAKNLSFSPSLLPEHDRLAKPEGPRGKWVVINAAMLALLDLTDAERQELMGRARSANDNSDAWDVLLRMSRQHALLEEIRRGIKATERFRGPNEGAEEVEGVTIERGVAKITRQKSTRRQH